MYIYIYICKHVWVCHSKVAILPNTYLSFRVQPLGTAAATHLRLLMMAVSLRAMICQGTLHNTRIEHHKIIYLVYLSIYMTSA